jgi:hypothetical protein
LNSGERKREREDIRREEEGGGGRRRRSVLRKIEIKMKIPKNA